MTKMYVFDRDIRSRTAAWTTGIGMLAVGIGALQIVLDKGQQEDWFESRFITVLVILSAVMLVALIVHELMTKDPVIELRIFKERSYAVGVFLMSIVGFVLTAAWCCCRSPAADVLGYPSMQAGIAMAPRGIGSLLTMPLIAICSQGRSAEAAGDGAVVGGSTLHGSGS